MSQEDKTIWTLFNRLPKKLQDLITESWEEAKQYAPSSPAYQLLLADTEAALRRELQAL